MFPRRTVIQTPDRITDEKPVYDGTKPVREIRIIAYNRPHYLRQALISLCATRFLEKFRIVASVDALETDGYCDEVVEILHQVTDDVRLRPRLDCNGHIHLNWCEAVEEGARFILHLEDDVCLASDALEWLMAHESAVNREDVGQLLCSGDRVDLVTARNRIHETRSIPLFNAWGAYLPTSTMQQILQRWTDDWNDSGYAWDCRVTDIYPELGLSTIMPVVPRARNIGAIGRYCTPDVFAERDRKVWSDSINRRTSASSRRTQVRQPASNQPHTVIKQKTKAPLAIISLFDGEKFASLADIIRPGIQRYCMTHKYDFFEYGGTLDPDRPVPWSKILAIRHHLKDYEWVFWMDTDCLFLRYDEPLISFTEEVTEDVIISRDDNGLNSGAFFVRNTPWARDFLDRVYARSECIHDPWWENKAIANLYAEDAEVKEHIRVFGQTETGEFVPSERASFNGYYGWGEWASLVMHLPGVGNEFRKQIMPLLVRKASERIENRLYERTELGPYLNRHGLVGEGAEIGVAEGRFSRQILEHWKGKKLYMVDAWRHLEGYEDISNVSDEEHEAKYLRAKAVASEFGNRAEIIRKPLLEAVDQFADRSLDFVYIDADHAYEAVFRDLRAWFPKLRPGGIFAGHDYLDGIIPEGRFGVKQAVDEFAHEIGACVYSTIESKWRSWYFCVSNRPVPGDKAQDSHGRWH